MLVNAQLRRVAILGGNRIPFARSNTAYATASNQQMLTAALQGLIDRFNLHGQRLDEVVAGAVIKHARDFNLTRETVLSTTLAKQKAAGSVLASDAFFPFPDGVATAAAAGVRAIVQPGGSKGDEAVIAEADRHGIAMVFTGVRHFRH